nr:hypothetical protein [uncultured Clostridium sp.]
MKRITAIVLFMLLLTLSTGCSNKNEQSDQPVISDAQDVENPFESNDSDTTIMGAISHGPTSPKVDESDKLLPWIYNGQDVQLNYYVNASGQAKNVGFLLFVDGVPQPYKVDSNDAAYEYMHTFTLKEDNTDLPFSFFFLPVAGKKGDLANITVASIYNPGFQPDMKETTSYGGYHALLPASYPLSIEADPILPDSLPNNVSETAYLTNEPVTNSLLETLSNGGLRNIDTDTFNREVFDLIYIDGDIRTDNYQVNSNGKLNVTYKLCGHPGFKYRTTFYINHLPVSNSDGVSLDTVIEKGKVTIINAEIDLEQLGDFSTFYAISVPQNAKDYPDEIFEPRKTRSILLYKKGE